MRIAVAICALVAFANALVGPSGIVKPDGQNIQFTHKFSQDIAATDHSGIITKSGTNILTHEQAKKVVLMGPSGIVSSDGKNIQFRQKRALVGPSGIVKPDGQNVQFPHKFATDIAPGLTDEQKMKFVLMGPSGIVYADGKNTQFRQKRALVGPPKCSNMCWACCLL